MSLDPDSATNFTRVARRLICAADQEGYFTSVNEAFTLMLGWEEHQLLNNPYLEFVHPHDREAFREALVQLWSGAAEEVEVEARMVSAHEGDEPKWYGWVAYLHTGTVYAVGAPRRARMDTERFGAEVLKISQIVREAEARETQAVAAAAVARTQREEAETTADEALTKAKTWQTWVAAVVAAAAAIGGALAWAVDRVEQSALQAKEVEDRKEAVDDKLDTVDTRLKKAERKILRVGDSLDTTQVQLAESTAYIVKKIDAAHPESKEEVSEPPAVEAARTRADAIQKKRRLEELFGDESEGLDEDAAASETEDSEPPVAEE